MDKYLHEVYFLHKDGSWLKRIVAFDEMNPDLEDYDLDAFNFSENIIKAFVGDELDPEDIDNNDTVYDTDAIAYRKIKALVSGTIKIEVEIERDIEGFVRCNSNTVKEVLSDLAIGCVDDDVLLYDISDTNILTDLDEINIEDMEENIEVTSINIH